MGAEMIVAPKDSAFARIMQTGTEPDRKVAVTQMQERELERMERE